MLLTTDLASNSMSRISKRWSTVKLLRQTLLDPSSFLRDWPALFVQLSSTGSKTQTKRSVVSRSILHQSLSEVILLNKSLDTPVALRKTQSPFLHKAIKKPWLKLPQLLSANNIPSFANGRMNLPMIMKLHGEFLTSCLWLRLPRNLECQLHREWMRHC